MKNIFGNVQNSQSMKQLFFQPCLEQHVFVVDFWVFHWIYKVFFPSKGGPNQETGPTSGNLCSNLGPKPSTGPSATQRVGPNGAHSEFGRRSAHPVMCTNYQIVQTFWTFSKVSKNHGKKEEMTTRSVFHFKHKGFVTFQKMPKILRNKWESEHMMSLTKQLPVLECVLCRQVFSNI